MRSIQQTDAWRGANRYGCRFQFLRPHQQLQVIIDVLGCSHLRRAKAVGSLTEKARAYITHQFLNDVNAAGFHLKSLLNVGQRHLTAAVAVWMQKELSPSTIQTRLSIIRWLCIALGKPGMVMDPSYYGVPQDAVRRTYVARSDKSWTGREIIPAEKIDQARQIDSWVGCQLDLMRAFGLRIKEAVMLRPGMADQINALRVEEGTKGGRTRNVVIRTEEQRAVLARARTLAARSARGSMCPPGRTVSQAIRRVYYVVGEKLGVTKAQLGVTPHGLRHQYANDLYETISGVPSAVRGGASILDRASDASARHAVTSDLGHGRAAITAAYTGPRIQGRPAAAVAEPPQEGSEHGVD